MKDFVQKIRLIFIPFLLTLTGTALVYITARWLLMQSNVRIDEFAYIFWIPATLPWIPILIWLRPRLKLLKLNTSGRRDPVFAYMMLMAATMGFFLGSSQEYFVEKTGKLTKLERIGQIDTLPKTKYYTVKQMYADKRLKRYKTRFVVSGKHNQDFDMYIYVSIPLYNTNHTSKKYNYVIKSHSGTINSQNALVVLNGKPVNKSYLDSVNPRSIKRISVINGAPARALFGEAAANGAILITTAKGSFADTLQAFNDINGHYPALAWLGFRYLETIRNNHTQREKDSLFKEFARSTEANVEGKSLDSGFKYFDRIDYSTDLKNYEAAINSSRYSADILPPIILEAVYEPFETRANGSLAIMLWSLAVGSVILLVALFFSKLHAFEDDPPIVP